jgi:hypothetical protein
MRWKRKLQKPGRPSFPLAISDMSSPLFILHDKYLTTDVVVSVGRSCREEMHQSGKIGIAGLVHVYRNLTSPLFGGLPFYKPI